MNQKGAGLMKKSSQMTRADWIEWQKKVIREEYRDNSLPDRKTKENN